VKSGSAWLHNVCAEVKFASRQVKIAFVLSRECSDQMPACVGWIEEEHLSPDALNQIPIRVCTRLLG
jgi:hypothetical protein